MECTLRKSEHMGDWYCIVRCEHSGTSGFRMTAYGMSFYSSERVTDCDIEGPAHEMLAIADAIETGSSASFKRCEAEKVDDGYALCSPRNDERSEVITSDEALRLAAEIRRVIAENAEATEAV